jgi:hypothetical protein
MFIINVATNDPIRVIRKLEEKQGQLLAITCPEGDKKFNLSYTLDN